MAESKKADKSISNSEYHYYAFQWQMAHDFVKGTTAVKGKNALYLPIPGGLTNVTPSPDKRSYYENHRIGQIPWEYSTNPAYESYLRRARVPDIPGLVVRRLMGLASRTMPAVDLPKPVEYMAEHATPDYNTLDEYYFSVLREVLITGRCGVMLDVNMEENQWTLKRFNALQCIDWKTDKSGNLIEVTIDEESNSGFPYYGDESSTLRTRLYLNEEGVAAAETKNGNELVSDNPISHMGTKFQGMLPFFFVGPTRTGADVDISPLHGVIDIAQQIYHLEADLAHAEFLTCNPTLVVTGAKEVPGAVGGATAFVIDDPQAKVYYTETDSAALEHMREHIEDLRKEAASAGADLMTSNRTPEATETVRLRNEAGNANLRGAVMRSGKVVKHLISLAAGDNADIEFEPSTEFMPAGISSQEFQALNMAYMNNTMSLETLIENYRRAGLLKKGETVEDELARLGGDPAIGNDE